MANSMLGADGLPLLFTARISSSRPPPRQLPDITVATPAGLIYASDNYSHHYGPAWTREGIVDRCCPSCGVHQAAVLCCRMLAPGRAALSVAASLSCQQQVNMP